MTLRPILDAFDRCATVRALAERLPARGQAMRLGGLPGSSGAVLATWLDRASRRGSPRHGDGHDASRRRALDHRSRRAGRRRSGPLSPTGSAGRGRAALRDRRRADRDAGGAVARRVAHPGHHRPRQRRADRRAGRAGGPAAATVPGRHEATRRPGRRAGGDGVPAGPDRGGGGRVLGPRRHRGPLWLRDGGACAARMVGRRDLLDPQLRPHHPAFGRGPSRPEHPADLLLRCPLADDEWRGGGAAIAARPAAERCPGARGGLTSRPGRGRAGVARGGTPPGDRAAAR